MEQFQVRDARTEHRYFVDNAIIRVYGDKLGPYGIAAYNALCVHADKDTQQCWPSYQTLADLVGMSKRQMMREIAKLVEMGLVHKESGKDGAPNTYTLLDPPCLSPWGDRESLGGDRESLGVVTGSHPNNPNKNNPKEQSSRNNPKEQKNSENFPKNSADSELDDPLLAFLRREEPQSDRERILYALSEALQMPLPSDEYLYRVWERGLDSLIRNCRDLAGKRQLDAEFAKEIIAAIQQAQGHWSFKKAHTPTAVVVAAITDAFRASRRKAPKTTEERRAKYAGGKYAGQILT